MLGTEPDFRRTVLCAMPSPALIAGCRNVSATLAILANSVSACLRLRPQDYSNRRDLHGAEGTREAVPGGIETPV
jgi:hypothetical protein